jgi:hypothetical protein
MTRDIHLRDVTIDSFQVEHSARTPDYDMAGAMNLMFRLKDREPLAYPVYRFGEKQAGMSFPMVLVVGDSYYWNIFNTGIPREVFGNEAFWYFGRLVYPDFYYQPTYTENLDIRAEIEKQDVILLMTTERFLYKFDWSLTDKLYSIWGKISAYDKVDDYASQITGNDEWFAMIIKKAAMKGISVEEMLYLDAKYVYREQEPENYMVFYGIRELEAQIRKDPDWMKEITAKAREKAISLEEMIRIDAEYMLSTNHPKAYSNYVRIRDMKETILKDSLLSLQTRREAAYFRMEYEEMLQIKAENMATATGRLTP